MTLYGVGHKVKDHLKWNLPSAAILSDQQQGIFYMHHPTDRIAHIMAFGTPVVKQRLEWAWNLPRIMIGVFNHNLKKVSGSWNDN